MSLKSAFNWNHDFPRLVRKLGFRFITQKPKVLIDWNLIGCLDIASIIANSEVYVLEQHINDVIYYSLQEEEVKILDPKFVKLFRISQLIIEYLVFCLHYLDKGFVQIQSKISDLEKRNEELCNEVSRKDKALEKSRQKIEEFEATNVFECEVCKKRFISETFLASHQMRRQHFKPTTEEPKKLDDETERLFSEIKILKERLNNTEKVLKVQSETEIDQCDTTVQCDLNVEEKNKMEIIRNELREWREEEASQILNQLERIKEKFNQDFQRICELHLNGAKPLNKLVNSEAQGDNLLNLEDKLDKKLKCTVDQLKDDLAVQEQKWRDKLNKLEIKNDFISEFKSNQPRSNPLTIQHHQPVVIKYNNTSSSSSPTLKQQIFSPQPKKRNVEPIPVFQNSVHVQTCETTGTQTEHIEIPQVTVRRKLSNVDLVQPKIVDSQSTLDKRSMTSLKDVVWNDPNFLTEFRATIKDVLHATLKDLGIDPEWQSIPKETFTEHMKSITHTQTFTAKNHPTYFDIRSEIMTEIDSRIKQQLGAHLYSKPSKSAYPPLNLTVKHKHPQSLIEQKLLSVTEQENVSPVESLPKYKSLPRTQSQVPIINKGPNLKNFRTTSLERQPPKTIPPQMQRSESLVFSSLTKLTNKITSVFKTKSPQTQRPWGGKKSPIPDVSPVRTEAVYKLTTESEPKPAIINITPVRKYVSSTTSEEEISPSPITKISVEVPSVVNSFMVKTAHEKPKSMYGDDSSDSVVYEPEEKTKPILNNKREIFQPIKKKVLFSLAKLKSDSSKSIEEQIKDLAGSPKRKKLAPSNLTVPCNDDSTSISSSVLDGSTKIDTKISPKKRQDKDELVLSDFDFSSN